MNYTKESLRISGPSLGSGSNDDGGDYAIIEPGGIIVGEAYHRVGESAYRDAEANARLWAAAPDMAEALKPFAAMADFYFSHDDDHVVLFGTDGDVTVGDVRRARAALERAKGAE